MQTIYNSNMCLTIELNAASNEDYHILLTRPRVHFSNAESWKSTICNKFMAYIGPLRFVKVILVFALKNTWLRKIYIAHGSIKW
jgi:hypothetical protein